MDGHTEGDAVRVGGDARQRFHDSRGYGRPLGGDEIALSRVEAAHLLFRGDLDAVDGDGFEPFFARAVAASERFVPRFLVYADLRERGFYLSPMRGRWPGAADAGERGRVAGGGGSGDFAVYERGAGPGGAVAYRVRVVGERRSIAVASLLPDAGDGGEKGERDGSGGDADAGANGDRALAVVDEESEITYFELAAPGFDGATDYDPPASLAGALLGDRVICWDAPDGLYERGFYGQPLAGRETPGPGAGALQLSLVEAASLAAAGRLRLSSASDGEKRRSGADAGAAVAERGRAVEGERFDGRLRVYRDLRARGVVPKTGYKFGADFRTYDEVTSVSELSHSERLVRVLPPDHEFDPRDLSLDVRLAGGVRKRMVFALTGANDEIHWLSVGRLTP